MGAIRATEYQETSAGSQVPPALSAATDWLSNPLLAKNLGAIYCPISILLSLFCGAYPLIVLAVQYAYIQAESQGVDFAMYAQIINRFAEKGLLETSLVDLRYQHFLTHHFSPYLYLLGWCARITGDPQFTLIALHAICIVFSMLGISRLLRLSDISPSRIPWYLALFTLLPSIRIGLLWEVHDEVYALPLVIWSLAALKEKRLLLFLLLISGLALIKETLFLTISTLACLGLLTHSGSFGVLSRRRERLLFATLAIFGVGAFILYTRILPHHLFIPTFDGFQRLCSISELFSPPLLRAKLWWATTVITPLIPLIAVLLFSTGKIEATLRLLPLMLPALPSIAAVMLTNFSGMTEPYNYYAILPVTVLFCAVVLSGKAPRDGLGPVFASMILAVFFGSSILIPKRSQPDSTLPDVGKLIPQGAVVITDDYAANTFYAHNQIIRLYHANKNVVRFDFIALRKHGDTPPRLSRFLRSWSAPVMENQHWIVRRALMSQAVNPALHIRPNAFY